MNCFSDVSEQSGSRIDQTVNVSCHARPLLQQILWLAAQRLRDLVERGNGDVGTPAAFDEIPLLTTLESCQLGGGIHRQPELLAQRLDLL